MTETTDQAERMEQLRRELAQANERAEKAEQERNELAWDFHRVHKGLVEISERMDQALDSRVGYYRCPKCNKPVAMSGVECLVGSCRFCRRDVTESDMGEQVDPLDEIERYREDRRQIWYALGPVSAPGLTLPEAVRERLDHARRGSR